MGRRRPPRSTSALAAIAAFLAAVSLGHAATSDDKDDDKKPADPDTGKSTVDDDTLGILPNPLERKGVKLGLTYIAETLGNVSGGARRGAIYEGRLNGAIDVDFAKAAGWKGLAFHANVFQNHGRGLSRDYVGNLMASSGVEARPGTRLYEAWFEQKFFDDKVALRAGQLAASDTEFIAAHYSDVFVNATYTWPTSFTINLPSGGPSPPLAAVGARVRADVTDSVTVLAGIYNGDPAGPGEGDPQLRNRHGLEFRTSDSRLLIGEAQYRWNQEKGATGQPGIVKLGGWHHNGMFDDQRFASNGAPQASASASADAARLQSNDAVYAVIEQQVARFGGADEERGIGVFGRASSSPNDRNLIDFYADGGVSVTGLVRSRPKDRIGVGFGYARISGAARDLDRDFAATSPRPIRDHEALITASYLAQIRPGWLVYPTVQYIIHPGGGYVLEAEAPKPVKNAAILGLRMTLRF